MRLILQTVKSADVVIEHQQKKSIKSGILCYVSFCTDDSTENVIKAIYKLAGLRIFNDENDKINLSLKDIDGELLIISNFTMYASLKKGFRPSFDDVMRGENSEMLYNYFVDKMADIFPGKVKTGKFGAYMEVTSVNDGPKNYILEC